MGRLNNADYEEAIDITKIPLDDARTFELFKKHKRTGFSIQESDVVVLKKDMQPMTFGLVAVLYFASGQWINPRFINRRERSFSVSRVIQRFLNRQGIFGFKNKLCRRLIMKVAGFTLQEKLKYFTCTVRKNSDTVFY